MRSSSLLLLSVAIVLHSPLSAQSKRHHPPAGETQTSQASFDKKGIQELDDAEIKANLALDVHALELLWDPDIVTMPPGHAAVVGLEANSQYLEQEAKEMGNFQILGYEQSWQEVRIMGEYTYEYGSIHTRVSPMDPGAGKEIDRSYNIMRILKRQPDDSWKIYRAIWNNSTPLTSEEKPESQAPDSQ